MEKIQLADLGDFAKKILEKIEVSPRDLTPDSAEATTGKRAYLVVLHGDLGAGKTTFVQALAKELWIGDTIQSPTYVLMKSYTVPPPPAGGWIEKLVHIDAYRLNDPQEFKTLKPEEFFSDPHTLVLFEWPERVGSLLPKPDLTIKFSADGASPQERYIEVI